MIIPLFALLSLQAIAQEGNFVVRKTEELGRLYIREVTKQVSSKGKSLPFLREEYEYLFIVNRNEVCIIRSKKAPPKLYKQVERALNSKDNPIGSYRFSGSILTIQLDGKTHSLTNPVVYVGEVESGRVSINKMLIDGGATKAVEKVFRLYNGKKIPKLKRFPVYG